MASEKQPVQPQRRIDSASTGSHAARIAENLQRIAAALPPLPLHIAAPPAAGDLVAQSSDQAKPR